MPHRSFDLRAERWNEIIGMDLSEHLYDDWTGFEKERERALMKAFALRSDVAALLHGPDSSNKERAFDRLETERVLKALDDLDAKKRSGGLDSWSKLDRRMKRLERAFDRHRFCVDRQLRQTSQYLRMFADQATFMHDVNDVPCIPPPEWQHPCMTSISFELDEREAKAVLKIERWWHKKFIMPGLKFRLRVLSSLHRFQHSHYHPEKAFESTAFRTWDPAHLNGTTDLPSF
eukprot:TRINITY_DN34269_c0_g1_i1.p2 TRINITY_DN34269_c0_g1~~TRINITY_DN34269_c0_g1_i1.p2  ORF type:complete len:232 (+),score=42.27 TRINITY_DN34269_c0_g1_i1:1363-2058(+)